MTYEIHETSLGEKSIRKIHADGSVTLIPNDEGNVDYQEYLKYLDESKNV